VLENIEKESQDTKDRKLVQMSLENSENFKYVISEYQNKFTQYIRRRTIASKEDAEDLLQDIFIKIYLNLNGFDNSLKFSSWAYRIAHNEIISWYRKKKIRPQINFEDFEEENLVNYFKEDTDLEKEYENKIVKNHIKEAIDSLDEKYREIIILRYLEEKDYEELSDILQIPLGTVSTLIYRGKKEMQKYLKKYYSQPQVQTKTI
jgi:RNA polymerase sigma-70 factor (ECF subfamily)